MPKENIIDWISAGALLIYLHGIGRFLLEDLTQLGDFP